MQPDQADFLLRSVFVPGLRNEHLVTKNVIAAIPLDKGTYRPDGISKSALDLAWHLVAAEMRFLEAVLAGEFDFTPRPLPESIKNSADLVAWYAEDFEPRVEKVLPLSPEQLTKIIEASYRCTCGPSKRRCPRSTAKASTPRRRAKPPDRAATVRSSPAKAGFAGAGA